MAKRRKRGSGSVHLRKDGRWEGRAVIGYDDKGLPKTKNVLARTKSECVQKLRELTASIGKPEPVAKPGMTLGQWLDHWYQSCKKPNLRPNTQMSYEQRIYNYIIPTLGDTPLDKLTQNDLQQFYTDLKQNGRIKNVGHYGSGLSDQTVRGCHTTLRSALEMAVSKKLINRNPADGCRLPPAKPREMQVLTPDEVQRLLIQAKEDGCYELLLLEIATGLRRGELLALQWNDLNFKTGTLKVERQVHRAKGELIISRPKTKAANRTIILPAPLLGVLKEYRKQVHSRWMFPSPRKADLPLDPASVRKHFTTILERAGCRHIRFHDLRHLFATMSLEHGMDVKTLSTVIGHVSSSTTLNIYAHITDEMRQTAACKIDQGISKVEPTPETRPTAKKFTPGTFQPYKGKRRKPGTGCVTQINDHLWEGRYSPVWPDGKKHPRNTYAHSEDECEKQLAEMILQMKVEIAAEKEQLKVSSGAS